MLWRMNNPRPKPLGNTFERQAAHYVHRALYVLLFLIMFSGYLISTADGRALEVFNWFSIPATLSNLENQEDIAGDIQRIEASGIVRPSDIAFDNSIQSEQVASFRLVASYKGIAAQYNKPGWLGKVMDVLWPW